MQRVIIFTVDQEILAVKIFSPVAGVAKIKRMKIKRAKNFYGEISQMADGKN